MRVVLREILACCLLVLPFVSGAQLHENVSVEGEYDPLVIETERINTLPLTQREEAFPLSLAPEQRGVVAAFQPSLKSMGITGWNLSPNWKNYRGYVDFNLGSFLNANLRAGYAALRDSLNALDLALRYNSTSLYGLKGSPDEYILPDHRLYYGGKVSADYSRLLGSRGLLEASIGYEVAYFNYYATAGLPRSDFGKRGPTQTVNEVNFHLGYTSDPSWTRGWNAGVSVNHLGYRQTVAPDDALLTSLPGGSETLLGISGGYIFPLNSISAVAVEGAGDFAFYPGHDPALPDWVNGAGNYGIISLRPAYRLKNNGFGMQVGVKADISYDAMGDTPGSHYGAFHIAPDIRFDYRKGQVGLFVTAGGGTLPRTLAYLKEQNLYGLPTLLSTQPIHSPVDAKIGLEFGPFAGFSGVIDFRYAVVNHTPVGGWYQVMLGTYPVPSVASGNPLYDMDYAGVNLRGCEVGMKLEYNLDRRVNVALSARYANQHGETGIFNGFDRPRLLLDASLRVRPISRLDVELTYAYRGLRQCYTRVLSYVGDGEPVESLVGYGLPAFSDLNARIGYDILDSLNIYCQANNILNRKKDFLPGLPSAGIAVAGGIDFKF